MAAADGDVCIYSIVCIVCLPPAFLLGAESGNLVVFSRFLCWLTSLYTIVTGVASTCSRKLNFVTVLFLLRKSYFELFCKLRVQVGFWQKFRNHVLVGLSQVGEMQKNVARTIL